MQSIATYWQEQREAVDGGDDGEEVEAKKQCIDAWRTFMSAFVFQT